MKRKAQANFLTKQMQQERDYAKNCRILRIGARVIISISVLCTIFFAIADWNIAGLEKNDEVVKAERTKLEAETKHLVSENELIEKTEKKDKRLYRHVLTISKVKPQEIALTEIKINENAGTVSGIAPSAEICHAYTEAIWRDEQLFADAVLDSIETDREGRKIFTIGFKLKQ